jgi:hypothetical protein
MDKSEFPGRYHFLDPVDLGEDKAQTLARHLGRTAVAVTCGTRCSTYRRIGLSVPQGINFEPCDHIGQYGLVHPTRQKILD